MKNTILFILIFSISCFKASCCDCGRDRITAEHFNSYDWIFIGTLINETRTGKSPCDRIGIYKIIKVYKGTIATSDTISICDAEDIGACGLGRLNIGRAYLIYAKGNEDKWTSDCTGTTRVPYHIWPRDSALIRKQIAAGYGGKNYDTLYSNFHADTLFLNRHVLKINKKGIQKFYDRQGKLSASGMYDKGIPEGYWTYYQQGNIYKKGKYLNGKKDSIWVETYDNGSIYIEEYKNDEFTQKGKTYFEGKISKKTEPIGDGTKWIAYNYHSNERPRYIAYAKPPQRDKNGRLRAPVHHGPFKMLNLKGIILQEGIDEDGLETGHWKYYYEDGKLRMEGDYIKGKKTGLWKIYYPNKKVKAEGTYNDGEKAGDWKYFDQAGKAIPIDPELIKEDEDWFTYSGVKH